jgi:catechol 2,3-dioxygenase-like lactoylglutathione lyase family enzyme
MKLDHVALATRDASGPLDVLAGELGGTILSGGHALGFRPMQVFLGDDTGGMKVELLEPWEPEQNDFLERFVARHGAGPHHLTFKVVDLEATIEHVRSLGYSPVGIDLADPQWQEAFLTPTEAHGTVVQLAQSNAALASPIDEYRFAAEHGPGGDPVWWRAPAHRAETPTFLRRVVLRTPTLPAALDFFGGLLEGETVEEGSAEQGAGWAELAWSSGGRIRLEEHAGATPGVDRLELEGPGDPRELTLAGARFVIRPS